MRKSQQEPQRSAEQPDRMASTRGLIYHALAEALDQSVGLVFMCSAHSLGSSHCQKELSYALDHDKPVFVVRLDDAELTPAVALYLNDTQLLERDKYPTKVYRAKLLSALSHQLETPAVAATTQPSPHHHFLNPRNVIVVITTVLSIALAGMYYTFSGTPFDSPPEQLQESQANTPEPPGFQYPRVAILPMETLTEDKVLDYLARASEEDLRERMQASVYEPVNVPDSALDMAPTEIGQLFNVDYVWSRSAAKQGDTVRIGQRLTETRTGQDVKVIQHVLQGSDPFQLQDQLAQHGQDIMGAVDRGESERADQIPLEEMSALDLAYTSKGDRIVNLRRALELAPDYYAAHSGLAWELFWSSVFHPIIDNPDAARAEALTLARRGWELAPFDQYAMSVAAQLELAIGNDPERAMSYLTPYFKMKSLSDSVFYQVLITLGRVDEALQHAEDDPNVGSYTSGILYLAADRYEEAALAFREQTQINPTEFTWLMPLANALGYLDRKADVDSIITGIHEAGLLTPVATYERGLRKFWGDSHFVEKMVGGLKKLGYE